MNALYSLALGIVFSLIFFFCSMTNPTIAQTTAEEPQTGVSKPVQLSPSARAASVQIGESSQKALAVRLLPDMDVKEELERIVRERGIKAAAVLTCVGSLRDGVVRFANKPNGTVLRGQLEIVSLTGTLGSESGSHLHIAVSDGDGRTMGGHVLKGCRVFTTAEIVLAVLPDVVFSREIDSTSGYKELVITLRAGK